MGWCLPCSLNEENQGRLHFECQGARMPFADLRKHNTEAPVWLTQWVTGTSRHCRQCRCYSSVQEHPYKHLPKTVPFLSIAAACQVLHALQVSSYPPKRAWRAKHLSPSVMALHGKVLVAGGLQGWLLWEAARSFPHVWSSQCQPALRRTCGCPRPSQSATVAVPLG